MKKHPFKPMAALFLALLQGIREEKDEYSQSRRHIYNGWLLSATIAGVVLCLLLSLSGEGINTTQLLVILDTVLILDLCGLALAHCTWGTLHVSDRFGGRATILTGILLMGLHWSFNIPMRQFTKGPSLYFVDSMAVGAVIFYFLCNSAYRGWYSYQNKLDSAQDDSQLPRLKHRFNLRTSLRFLLFLLIVLCPSWLNYQIYSTDIMEQAKEQYQAGIEAKRTPEFTQYESLMNQWQTAPDEEYIKVFLSPQSPMFFTDKPTYENAGCLLIHTSDKHMELLFTEENGTINIFQSTYLDFKEPDEQRVKHLYGPDRWYNHEEYMVNTQRNVPGFDTAYDDYGEIIQGDSNITPDMMEGNVTITQLDNGYQRYRFQYSADYLNQMNSAIKSLGFDPGKDPQRMGEFLTDPNQTPIEYYYEDTIIPNREKEPQTTWSKSRFHSRNSAAARNMMEQMIKNGPSIPDDVLNIYHIMLENQ